MRESYRRGETATNKEEMAGHLERLKSSLLSFGYTLTHDRDATQDLYQETAYNAIKFADKYQVDGNIKSRLFTIMKNIYINQWRKKKKKGITEQITDQTKLGSIKNTGIHDYDYQQLKETVFATLNDTHLDPFRMYYLGYKYTEIAERLSIPEGTAKSKVFSARQQLKKALTPLALKDT